ncbi:DUF1499 domain-containing protein [Halomonas sp. BM-2019]|uniref:DUF1499 domain-containing protein n=1 Tax=Halomonas sp. BM-2019 TaxID=2811227 RepID=UPI001B3C218E|nr:MAG: DUF1499 domain-containing protein [Halomonas sp. BM-2019]
MPTFRPRRRQRGGPWPALLAWLTLLLLIAAALMMGGAGPAHRLELLPLGSAFDLLRLGAYLALAAAALGLVTLIVASLCRRWRPALAGGLVLVAVAAMMAVPWQLMQRAQEVPPIHDITTDLEDPPPFVALAETREAAPNAVGYPEGFADQQRAAYPEIQPLLLDLPPARVLSAVEAAALDQGWEIVALSETGLEATATTFWFGFRDDVAIRLTQTEEGVRVDVRSASRQGRSDLGTNAARIRTYLEALQRRAEG